MPYLIALILIILDQFTKYIFYNKKLFTYTSIFSKHVFNTGISWWIKIFPFDILKIITVLVLVWVWRLYKKKYIWTLTFTLILAGWIWNLIDRFYLWWVRDFITIFNWFPTFNLADSYISLWFLIIFIENLEKK